MPDTPGSNTGRTIDWAALVKKLMGQEKPQEDVVYRFSNGTTFKSTDHTTSGIYQPPES